MLRWCATNIGAIYDWLDQTRQRSVLEKTAVMLAAGGFLAHLSLILLARSVPTLGEGLLVHLDRNYLHAVYTPFSFILFLEVILLVLALPHSHTSSVARQYQIISLIVVRRVFKDIGEFRDLQSWLAQLEETQTVLYDMVAAALMFLIVTLFYQVRNLVIKSPPQKDLDTFILIKKVVAVLLLGVFVALAAYNVATWFQGLAPQSLATTGALDWDLFFFPTFYEFMIFTDVFLLILSISFYERYEYVFRNAGFVISTVLLRFSLSTSKPYDLLLALVAMTYGLIILSIFAYFTRVAERDTAAVEDSDSRGHI